MIISASRRTDIPAFYSDWFMGRIRDKYFVRVNPYNIHQKKVFPLTPLDVDAIVFWTKNPLPLMKYLDELDLIGFNYYFQFTVNNYSKIFEPKVPNIKKTIETFKELSNKLGPERVIWRYDPIILSNVTNVQYHINNYNMIANSLKGYTKRSIISFVDIYDKIKNRINKLQINNNIKIADITQPQFSNQLSQLLYEIKNISNSTNMQVYTCSENIDLSQYGIEKGGCIDGNLISKLFNCKNNYKKDKNQRPECLCAESVDMGMYNTCKHNCIYCYANYSEKAVLNNVKKHNPKSPTQIGEFNEEVKITYSNKKKSNQEKTKDIQLTLFEKDSDY